ANSACSLDSRSRSISATAMRGDDSRCQPSESASAMVWQAEIIERCTMEALAAERDSRMGRVDTPQIGRAKVGQWARRIHARPEPIRELCARRKRDAVVVGVLRVIEAEPD